MVEYLTSAFCRTYSYQQKDHLHGYNEGILDHKHRLQTVLSNAPKGTKVLLDVGDMLVYSGCELEHWREPLEGDVCGQVFLHYNHVNGPFAEKNRFDKRPMLGIPPIRNT